jgi:hypothetical protein
MEKSSFFNSVRVDGVGDRKYLAADWAEYFASFIGNGVFPAPSDGLQVLANGSVGVTIRPGKAFINGYYYENTENLDLPLGVADGTLKKIARIVLRWDLTARHIYAAALLSGVSSNPAPQALTRNAEVYEIAIADVLIRNGVTAISQSDITDRRHDSTLCGIVTGVVQQIDFSAVTAQFDSFFVLYRDLVLERYAGYSNDMGSMTNNAANIYAEFMNTLNAFETGAETDFYSWFENLQSLLDGDVAANLAAQIENHEGRITVLEDTVSELVKQSPSYTVSAVLGDSYIGIAYLKESEGGL